VRKLVLNDEPLEGASIPAGKLQAENRVIAEM